MQSDVPARAEARRARSSEQWLGTEQVRADLRGRTVRGGAATVAAEVLKQALRVAISVVMARALTPEDNGLVAMVVVITGFLGGLNELGLLGAIVQRDEISHAQVSSLFWVNQAVSVGLTLLTIALAPLIAWFYGEPRLTWITIAISLSFILSGLTLQHRALMRRQMQFTQLALIDVGAALIECVAGIWAALAGLGYWSLVLMILVAAPVEIIATWLACSWRPGRPAWARGTGSLLAFGGNLTGFNLLNRVARTIDNLLIGRLYGPGPLGLYTKAYSLLLMPLHRVNTIASVAVPALSRLADAPERYRRAYTQIAQCICLATMPLVAFLIGSADWVVLVVLGPQWEAAGRIFSWLGLSGLVEPFMTTVLWLMLSQGRANQQLRWGVISSALVAAAVVAGLPWGAEGVAAAYGLSGLLVRAPLLFWFAGRAGPVRTGAMYRILGPFAAASAASLLAVGGLRLLAPQADPLLGIACAAGLTAATTAAVLAALPAGRASLRGLAALPQLFSARR